MPSMWIFLDVDNLKDIDKLEEHVKESALFAIILSKGYFKSRNVSCNLSHPLVL